MRARRIEVADAVHDGELAVVPELLHGREVRRDAVGLVQMHDLLSPIETALRLSR